MFKKIISSSLLLTFAFIVEANASHGRAWSSTNEGKFALSINTGITPTFYLDRKKPNNSGAANANFMGVTPPQFKNQSKMPYDLSGEIAYMVRKQWEVFYDFDWNRAKGKLYTFTDTTTGINFSQQFSKYNAYGNYLGTRYYFSMKKLPVRPFVGAKIGLLCQNSLTVYQAATLGGTVLSAGNVGYYGKKNSFAGGLQIGVDWQLIKNLSLTLKTEAIGSFSRKGNTILNRPPIPLFKVGSTGTQLLTPVTFGVKLIL